MMLYPNIIQSRYWKDVKGLMFIPLKISGNAIITIVMFIEAIKTPKVVFERGFETKLFFEDDYVNAFSDVFFGAAHFCAVSYGCYFAFEEAGYAADGELCFLCKLRFSHNYVYTRYKLIYFSRT